MCFSCCSHSLYIALKIRNVSFHVGGPCLTGLIANIALPLAAMQLEALGLAIAVIDKAGHRQGSTFKQTQ